MRLSRELVGILAAWTLLDVATGGRSLADKIITQGGAEFTGKVIEQGDSYRLVTPGGGAMTFPKNTVKEVVTGPADATPAGVPTSAAQDAKVFAVLKPLRDKVDASKAAVVKATEEVMARCRKEFSEAVAAEEREPVQVAQDNYDQLQKLASGLGKPSPGLPSPGTRYEKIVAGNITTNMPDGTSKTVTITPQNAGAVLAEARGQIAACRAAAKARVTSRLTPEHRKELEKYTALNPILVKAEGLLRDAAVALAPIIEDDAKVIQKVAEYEKQILGCLEEVAKGLRAASGHPDEPGQTEAPAGVPPKGAAPPSEKKAAEKTPEQKPSDQGAPAGTQIKK